MNENDKIQRLVKQYRHLVILRDDIYAVQKDDGNYTCVREALTDELLYRHIVGDITIGFYTSSIDNTTKTLCFDIDHYENNKIVVAEIITALGLCGIDELYVEFSGGINEYGKKKYHVWVFLNETEASIVKAFGEKITAYVYKFIGEPTGNQKIEVFPKNDFVSEDKPGNLIKLPYAIHRVTKKRSKFKVGKKLLGLSSTVKLFESISPIDLPKTLPDVIENATGVHNKNIKYLPLVDKDGNVIDEKPKVEKPTNVEVKNTSGNESEALKKLKAFLLYHNKKYCRTIVFNQKIQLNGEEGHNFRWLTAYDWTILKLEDELKYEYFRPQADFNLNTTADKDHSTLIQVRKTHEYVDNEIEKKLRKKFGNRYAVMNEAEKLTERKKIKLHTCKCKLLKSKCGSIVKPYCPACKAAKAFTKMVLSNGDIASAFNAVNARIYKPIWDEVQKVGFKKDDFILVYTEDMNKILTDYGFIPDETRHAWYNNDLIEGNIRKRGDKTITETTMMARLPNHDKSVRAVFFNTKAWTKLYESKVV